MTPTVVQITITTSPANLLVSADGVTAVAAPLIENWVAGSTHTITTTSPQAGGAGVQYVWSNWNDGGLISHSIIVPSTPTTYTATFNTQYQLTTKASPSADGSVTPVSGSYYAGGATIPVTATANAGFQFTNWTSTGGSFGSPTSSSTNFTMPSAPATVTGNFIALTTTALMSSPNPSTYGESVTFTATVTSSGGTPNGSVNFKIGATSLGVVNLVGGSASLTTSALSGGSHTITAHYSGATKYAASSFAVIQTVDKVATTTLVITSASPSTFGNPVTFTATVSSSVGTPAGNVVFKDGTTLLGTVPLGPGGTAQFTTSALAVGRHLIHANYQGNNDYTGGTAQVRQVVQ